jgi:hypothetical protein
MERLINEHPTLGFAFVAGLFVLASYLEAIL